LKLNDLVWVKKVNLSELDLFLFVGLTKRGTNVDKILAEINKEEIKN
jgi:hypothetical protein